MFARSCQERRNWDQVVRMTDIILQRYSESEFTADAFLLKAGAGGAGPVRRGRRSVSSTGRRHR